MALFDITTPLVFLRVQKPGQAKATPLDLNFVLEGQISSRLRSFTFTDSEKGSDKLSMTLWNRDLRFIDDPAFDEGNKLVVAWGYAGYLSDQREMIVTSCIPGFEVKIEAEGSAILANKEKRTDLWPGLRWSQIVERIAERNGYGAAVRTIEDAGPAPPEVPQNGKTDAEFCKWVAKQVGFQFWIDQRGLFFGPRKLDQPSKRSFTLGVEGPDGLLDFPQFEKAPRNNPGKVKLQGVDTITKKPFEVTADDKSTKGRPGLASILELIDPVAGTSSLRETAAAPDVIAPTSAQTKQEAQKRADGLYKLAQTTPRKCTAPAYGDPKLPAKSIVTLSGIGQRLSGNYYVAEIVHTIGPGGYTMSMKCQRDGTSSAGKTTVSGPASSAAVNTSQGASATDATSQLQSVEVVDRISGQTRTEFRKK
jgi:phage protein D